MAPIDKLDATSEKLVKDLKDANVEKRRLIKELATKESASIEKPNAKMQSEEVDGIKLVKRDFHESMEVNRMVQTATEVLKRDEATVALFFGSDGKIAKILVMAGKKAVKNGVNASEVLKGVSTLIGGGGGGRPNFAQAGGTNPEKLGEAVAKAEKIIKSQLIR